LALDSNTDETDYHLRIHDSLFSKLPRERNSCNKGNVKILAFTVYTRPLQGMAFRQ